MRDVTFDVARGETFVVMGLSGSGKSTLIRCVARLNDVTKGKVVLDGEDLTAMNDEQLREVRQTQDVDGLPAFRPVSHIAGSSTTPPTGSRCRGSTRPSGYERAMKVLEVVGLKGWEQHFPQQLSGGMQQRVGLARALTVDPEILFFDEPFSALDPLIRRDMQDELIRLQETLQRTIVFITHDFAEAIKLGDRIAIMKDGAFDQVGTAAELITHPATDYVREFTKDIPKTKVLTAASVLKEGDGRTQRPDGPARRHHRNRAPGPAPRHGSRSGSMMPTGSTVGVVDREAVATCHGDPTQ